ncbi:MAG: methyltransferase domain-containing protein [Clostridia bacterium]|nr:methyltransferase domain-containing protein [Clostridia bacterium]
MSGLICPVCRELLLQEERLYRCGNGHCFDKSKFGYVNLLQSQKSSAKRHGDDRLMIRARRDFLDKGYYGFLRDELCHVSKKYLSDAACVADVGCGECYYSSKIYEEMKKSGCDVSFFGIDISKDALEFAFKRKCGFPTAVASIFSLPFANCSLDAVLNVFAPEADGEFLRVLKKGGLLIKVIPLENHLFELKKVIYDKPYLNEVPPAETEGFQLAEEIRISREITVSSNEDISNLFKMTPYYYKTGIADQKKTDALNALAVQAEFGIRIYKKDDLNA